MQDEIERYKNLKFRVLPYGMLFSRIKQRLQGIVRKGAARRVIFFYPGEEGSYVEDAEVTLYDSGIVMVKTRNEETTAHIHHVEIIWNFGMEKDDRMGKVRLLRPKEEQASYDENQAPSSLELDGPEKTH